MEKVPLKNDACTSNRSVSWAAYNGKPRTGTYLSCHTSVCSALEYSNDCWWTLKSPMQFYSTSSPWHHLNMLCEERGFLRREKIRWILGKKGNETLHIWRFVSLAGSVSKAAREPIQTKFTLSFCVQMNNPVDTSQMHPAPLLSWLHLRFQSCFLAAVCQISLYIINKLSEKTLCWNPWQAQAWQEQTDFQMVHIPSSHFSEVK